MESVRIFCLLILFFSFFSARTSSENFSSSFILITVATFIFSIRNKNFSLSSLYQNLEFNPKYLFFSAFFSGLAFESRFQSAFFIIGFFLWIYFNIEEKLYFTFLFFTGVITSVFIGFLLDSYCYGNFVFTPWNYFNENILKGAAGNFGSSPFHKYPYYLRDFFPNPIGPLIVYTLIFSCIKFWKNIFVWSFISFLAFHSFIAHKETRFMFPILFICVPLVCESLFFIFSLLKKLKDNTKFKFIHIGLNLLLISIISICLISILKNFIFLFFTIYEVKSDKFSFLNVMGQSYYRELKALEYLQKNVTEKLFLGLVLIQSAIMGQRTIIAY